MSTQATTIQAVTIQATTTETRTPATPTAQRIIGDEWVAQQGDGAVTLAMTRCQSCSAAWFPPREVCSACASPDVEQVRTAAVGVSYATTVVRIGPGQFRPPYTLSYVDISGVRVLAHVPGADPLPPDTPVRLTLGEIGEDADGVFSSYVAVPTAIVGGAS